jgi:transcriptional regulator with XRE-family HTH domain
VHGLGQRIRQRREELGLRQQDLATALHASPQSISKWERGENDPDIVHLPTLAKLLQVSIDWLLEVDGRLPVEEGSVAVIGVTTARLRGTELNPRSFAGWCQSVLDRSVAAVEAAAGTAVTSHGPGLIATFSGAEHARYAWQAVQNCCQIHEVPLKIGVAQGPFHLGEIRVGRGHRLPDVFGDPVSQALMLADWVAGRDGNRRVVRHAIAWKGARPTEAPIPAEQHRRLALDGMEIEEVTCWFL